MAGAGLCHDDAVRFVVERGRQLGRVARGPGGALHARRPQSRRAAPHPRRWPQPPAHRPRGRRHRQRGAEDPRRARSRPIPNIEVLEWHIAVDLITSRKLLGDVRRPNRVWGAYVLDRKAGHVRTIAARFTILATGGAGKVYLYTTNPDTATGDGVAMGWRAGAAVAEHGVHPVPPDLPLPPAREVVPDLARRCAAKAGCSSCPTASASCRGTTSARSSRRATSWPAPSTSRSRSTASTASTSTSRTSGAEFIHEHFPTIQARCLEFGIDITQRADPRGAGGALHLRRPRDGPARAHPAWAASMRWAKWRAPGCTAPTASRRTRCSNASCSRNRRRSDILALELARPAPAAGLGRKPRHRRRRGSRDLAQLGRAAPHHVELRGHRAHQQAPGARAPPHRAAAGRRSRSSTASSA